MKTYQFVPARWSATSVLPHETFTVRGEIQNDMLAGTVIRSSCPQWEKGEKFDAWGVSYFDEIPAAKPFRALNGRFAKKQTVTVYLREIRVVPVLIEAASIDEAEEMVRAGEGDYQNDKATHSDLSTDEYFHLFERDSEIVK